MTWLVFGQTLRHDFVNYDDDSYVYAQPMVASGVTLPGLGWAFTHVHARNWHPLTTISHMIDCQLFGLKAGRHHFTNVLLHSVAVVLLFLVLEAMTGAVWRSAFVAAVFAIHPLRVESVAWIAERKDVLSAVFFFLTLAAYLCYARKPTLKHFVVVAIIFACGLLSKPMLVTLPFVLLLLDYWPLGRISDTRSLRKALIEKVPLLALSVASSVATVIAQSGRPGEMDPFPIAWRINNSLVSYLIYIGQMFWPAHLTAFYPHPENRLPVWEVGLAGVILVAISVVAVLLRRKRPYLFVGWFWYLGMLVPVIGLFQVGMQGHADRYTYLPHIGLCFALTWTLADLAKRWPYRRRVLAAGAAIAVVALAWKAHAEVSNWQNSESLWQHALAITPDNQVAHNNLAALLEQRGELNKAITHYQQSIKIQSSSGQARHRLELAQAHTNLANALLSQGDVDGAVTEGLTAITLQPNLVDAYTSLGNAHMQKRAIDEATSYYEKALQIAPDSIVTLNNLALIFATSIDAKFRDGPRAIQLAKHADELCNPKNPSIMRTLAAAYAEAGQFDDAIATGQQASTLAKAHKDVRLANEIDFDVDLYKVKLPRHGR
jgi:tetratricopeptide (TPR) repeat protein